MSYRPSSNAPRTAWARHLDTVMRDRGWSRVRLFEEVGAELGYAPKSRSGMLPLLEDREPTPAQADVLRRHFGEPPALDDPASTGAHTPEAGSISDLIDEMRQRNKLDMELIEQQKALVAAIERAATAVLQGQADVSSLLQTVPSFDPRDWRWVQEQDGSLSPHPIAAQGGTPGGSSRTPAALPSR